MGKKSAPHLARFLPQVVLATFVVSILPLLVVWKLREHELVTSLVALIGIGVCLSCALGWLGRLWWERRTGATDLLFGELMLWGFLRRWRTERRLASASRLLGLGHGHGKSADRAQSDREQQARLLESLAGALEARDPYTHGHSRRVARHAERIARTMGLGSTAVSEVRAAAVVHDVGKLDIPKEILNKPGRLTDDEFEIVKTHPVRGAEMMVERDFPPALAEIVAHHHERIDGTGYPDGLVGDEIPLGSRIIAVADTFDALTSKRPYRPARPHRQALGILSAEAGSQLDPEAVRAFLSHYSGFRPLAIWAMVTHIPQRAIYPLLGELQAGAASAAKVAATTAVAVGAAGLVAGHAAVGSSGAADDSVRVAADERGAVTLLDPRDTWRKPDGERPEGTRAHGRQGNPAGPGGGGSTNSGGSDEPVTGGGGGGPTTGGDGNRTDGGGSGGGDSGSGVSTDNGGSTGGGSSSGSGSGSGNSGSGSDSGGSGSSDSGSSGSGESGSGSGSSGSGSGSSGSGSSGGGNSGSGGSGGNSGSGGGGGGGNSGPH
jgi:putative nucleotidyltransferase with HDIG domain